MASSAPPGWATWCREWSGVLQPWERRVSSSSSSSSSWQPEASPCLWRPRSRLMCPRRPSLAPHLCWIPVWPPWRRLWVLLLTPTSFVSGGTGFRFRGDRLRLPWYKYPFNAAATALYVGLASMLFHGLSADGELMTVAVVPRRRDDVPGQYCADYRRRLSSNRHEPPTFLVDGNPGERAGRAESFGLRIPRHYGV